jgi:hypothetical protein
LANRSARDDPKSDDPGDRKAGAVAATASRPSTEPFFADRSSALTMPTFLIFWIFSNLRANVLRQLPSARSYRMNPTAHFSKWRLRQAPSLS